MNKELLGNGIEEDVLTIRDDMIKTANNLKEDANNASAMHIADAICARMTASHLEYYAKLLKVK